MNKDLLKGGERMANEQNLIPNSERTPSERREIAQKGGIASGEARRRRKSLKEELELLLSDGNMQERIGTALLGKALKGDTRAFEVIRDTIGEKPAEELRLAGGVRFRFDGMPEGDDLSG